MIQTLEELLTFKTITIVHDIIIRETGGTLGIHDENLIRSSLVVPLQNYFGRELYPNPIEKGGALFYSIIKNHGFTDGNKRTACLMLTLILRAYGFVLTANNRSIEKMAIDTANNTILRKDVLLWIYHNIDFIEKNE